MHGKLRVKKVPRKKETPLDPYGIQVGDICLYCTLSVLDFFVGGSQSEGTALATGKSR